MKNNMIVIVIVILSYITFCCLIFIIKSFISWTVLYLYCYIDFSFIHFIYKFTFIFINRTHKQINDAFLILIIFLHFFKTMHLDDSDISLDQLTLDEIRIQDPKLSSTKPKYNIKKSVGDIFYLNFFACLQ
jgi:hypothetical protein